MEPLNTPRTPKQTSATSGKASWYSYYAGYSPDFVADVIRELSPRAHARLIDPWNGAGTTTQVADELGVESVGYDINPVMVVVAKARLLATSQLHPSEASICQNITTGVATEINVRTGDDPLAVWLTDDAAAGVRALESRIRRLLVPNAPHPLLAPESLFDCSQLSCIAAFFYVALFRVVRNALQPFQTSNPTWIKTSTIKEERLALSVENLVEAFATEVAKMVATNTQHIACATVGQGQSAKIAIGNSTALPDSDNSATAVISSPPYCTRIDYAVATRPELAVLGVGADRLRRLRDTMIGTATIPNTLPTISTEWGPTCEGFLSRVADHPSWGSRNYYWKNHLFYFDGIYRSLTEIDRVLIPGGDCVLVVQDSYYKEVHNDLPAVIEEMAAGLGWSIRKRHRYDARTLMARVHPGAKTYRAQARATESVLRFATAM